VILQVKKNNAGSFGLYFCKALATIGVWAGCVALGALGLIFLIGPIIALYVGLLATVMIWAPDEVERVKIDF